jgi:NAD(P)-dependent dehydrogenase (short-subunit alcohol dehydrogenase family)
MTTWKRTALMGMGVASGGMAVRWLRPGKEADFTGKVVLITGGSRGLGLLLAREFGRAGCRIAIAARDVDELEEARRILAADRYDALPVVCDVTSPQEVQHAIRQVESTYGCVDVLVNNAGIIGVGPLSAMTADDFREAMDVMFWGMLHPTLAVLPAMRARREGSIVNITSIGGKISVPHLLPYSSAKFAAVGLSEGLRAELAPAGVAVTTIVPGLMRTGSFVHGLFTGNRKSEYAWFSLGATLPVISMDAERAARQIVRAARRGEAERILSLPAAVGARVHGVFPGATTNLLGLIARLLPDGTAPKPKVPGAVVDRHVDSPLFGLLTSLGRAAVRRFNE